MHRVIIKVLSLSVFLVFMLSFCSVVVGQDSPMAKALRGVETRISKFPLEKVFVHTDRPNYVAGDDMWFALYAVDGSDHSHDPVSGFAYVELIDPIGNVKTTKHVQLNGKKGHGLIELQKDLKEGKYQVRAYTSYMLNYSYEYAFTKEIIIYAKSGKDIKDVPNEKQDYALRFFPEGGELVADIPSNVAFELVDKTISTLELLNSKNEVVSQLKVAHDGIGSFTITPTLDEEYKVVVDGKDYKLPYINPQGYGIKVNNLRKNSIYVDLQSSADYTLDGGFVIGHIRGLVFLQQDSLSGNVASLKIDKNRIPEGVAVFTLFDNKGRAVAERSVFVLHPEEKIDVEATIPFQYINTRQKVDLTVKMNQTSTPIDADFSISIMDARLLKDQEDVANIRSYLLLGSEFTKPIHNLNSYFVDDSKKTSYYLDLLMMTKKWSRIRWQDVNVDIYPELKYLPESGFTVSGMLNYKGDPIQGYVDISVIKDSASGDRVQTDANGKFFVNLIGIQDSSTIYVIGGIDNQIDNTFSIKSEDLTVVLFSNNRFDVESTNVIEYSAPNMEDVLNSYIEQRKKQQSLDSLYNESTWSIELDEVSIKARNISKEKEIRKETTFK